jgi:outer membrane protein assembly factor BamB
LLVAAARPDDWPQFRGPLGNGVSANAQVPVEWSNQKHLAWKLRIPGAGWSQPVIVGNLIFLTAAVSGQPWRPKDYASGTADPHTVSGDKVLAPDMDLEWKVLAVDLPSGAIKWATTVVSGKPKYPIHPSNTYASETPVADKRGVYAWFGACGTMAALDHAGHLFWRRQLGVFRQQNNLGTGSSPRLYQGLLYIQCFNEEQAFVACLDAKDGREKWRITREKPETAWTTPLVWHNERRAELIVYGQKLMTSHQPLTGQEIWRASGVEMPGPSSLAADGRRVYFGFRSSVKRTSLYALAAGADGDQSVTNGLSAFKCEAWAVAGAAPGMASPVAADGCVYVLNDAVLSCYDAASGKEHFKERLPGFRCAVASPVVAGHKLVAVDESGSAVVLKTGPKFDLLGRSKLDDAFWASPAVTRDALVLRGVDCLYCIRE